MKTQRSGNLLKLEQINELTAANSEEFRAALDQVLDAGVAGVEIDLSSTRFIDSCGLGALIHLRRWCATHDARMLVVNPSRNVSDVLWLTRLSSIFGIEVPAGVRLIPGLTRPEGVFRLSAR